MQHIRSGAQSRNTDVPSRALEPDGVWSLEDAALRSVVQALSCRVVAATESGHPPFTFSGQMSAPTCPYCKPREESFTVCLRQQVQASLHASPWAHSQPLAPLDRYSIASPSPRRRNLDGSHASTAMGARLRTLPQAQGQVLRRRTLSLVRAPRPPLHLSAPPAQVPAARRGPARSAHQESEAGGRPRPPTPAARQPKQPDAVRPLRRRSAGRGL